MTSVVEKRFLFNLKFSAKELATYSWRFEKMEKKEIVKLKQAAQESNKEMVFILAENVVRLRKMARHYIQMASRVDAAANRIQTFWSLMDKLEKEFEYLDVQSACTENTTSQTTTVTFPVNDHLMRHGVEEAGIELDQLPKEGKLKSTTVTSQEQDELAQRLAKLMRSQVGQDMRSFLCSLEVPRQP